MEATVVTIVRPLLAPVLVAILAVSAGGAAASPSEATGTAAVRATAAPTPATGVAQPQPAVARYVSPRGDDANPGTLARPWRTIGKAMRTLLPGRTAYVRAGTYREALDTRCGPSRNALHWRRSGRPGAPITIAGYPGEEKDVVVATKINLYGNHLRLMNLVLDRNASHSSFDKDCTGSVNVAVYGDFVELARLEVRNAMMSGLYISGADRLRVVRSWIHDNGTHEDLDHGLYVGSSSYLLLANNVIDHNLAYGIHVYPDDTDDARIVHNTVVEHGRSGLIISGDSTRNTIANNILAFNREYGLMEYELTGEGNVAIRNLLFGNGTAPSRLSDGRLQETESVLANPRFVRASTRDYRLRLGSAALSRALPAYMMPRDFAGRQRPRGAGPDLGAFER